MPCWVFMLAFSAALIAGQDASAQTRKFKSWSASCPEGACAGDTAAQGGKISLRLSRADSPVAPWHISLRGLVRSLAKTSPLTVQVDQGQPMRLAPGSGYRALDGEFFIVDQ